jgi:1,2-diacylglycerol 3-alpha-glucosyltransferase
MHENFFYPFVGKLQRIDWVIILCLNTCSFSQIASLITDGSKTMRIGMMADVYKPHISGITNYIDLNKQVLEKSGHEVFVFTFGDENYQDDERNVIRSPGLPLLDTGYFLSFRYTKEARRLLRTMDIVHVHHPFLSGSLALHYCRPRGIPIVFTNHTRYDLYAKVYMPVLPDIIGETALEAYLPSFSHACDLVISPSSGMREVLLKFGVNVPIEVIPNGVDFNPLNKEIKPISRLDMGIKPEDIVLIYSGRLGPEKNLTFLLRSFAAVCQAFDNIHLILVGDGPERDNLEDRTRHMQLESKVHITGMIPLNQVYRYLAGADIFVTASVTEVHPLSVIEAMASGLPVVGIDSPGISDTIEDGKTGLLVKEEDLATFTAKLVRLIAEPQWREAMGQNARQSAEKYAIEKTSGVLVKKYQEVVAQKLSSNPGMHVMLTRFLDRWR